MEKILFLCFISLLFSPSICNIQTGTIDINRQLGNLLQINDFASTLCYTQIFEKSFINKPKIATSLTQFGTSSDYNYQIQIRIRKSQVTENQVKFMIFARKQISLWAKVVINYIASDREEFHAANLFLNTEDLAGCGQILSQKFQIPLQRKYKKLYLATFINGFDMYAKNNTQNQSTFELSTQIIQKYQDKFILSISRTSNTQIYSISVSYIAIQQIITQIGYSLEIDIKTQTLQSPPSQSPFIFTKSQQNINSNSNTLTNIKQSYLYMIGFSKFKFVSKQNNNIKSLALEINQENISIGSFDSKNLALIQYSYMIIKQSMKSVPQFMEYDEKNKILKCINGYFQIKQKGCKKLPQNMIYDEVMKIFKCDNKNGIYHSVLIGKCRKIQQNQEWNQNNNQFSCIKDTYRIQQKCKKVPQNMRYSSLTMNFVCNDGYYDINGICLAPPTNMRYQSTLNKFVCIKGYQQITKDNSNEIQCIQIPENKQWNPSKKHFQCIQQYYQLKDNSCKKPKQNQKYNLETKQFICINNYIRINSLCSILPLYSIYQQKQNTFNCIQGYYKKDQYSCGKCKQQCKQCIDENNCKNCKNGFQVYQKYIQNGYKYKGCKQICGDGIKYNLQCDDGNKIDGDGCSSQCKKQQNYLCNGGSPVSKDVCTQINVVSPTPTVSQIKLLGMTHLYGKIILNIKVTYLPQALINQYTQLINLFRILTNSKIQLKTTTLYTDFTNNIFVIIYDFNKYQPIPEYVTRVEINPEVQSKYFNGITVKPLSARVNPVYMAKKDTTSGDTLN